MDEFRALAITIDLHARLTVRRLAPHPGKLAPEYRALLDLHADDATLAALHDRYGGSIRQELQPNGMPRRLRRYELTTRRLLPLLRDMRPHLVRQAAIADALIELIELRQHTGAHRTKHTGQRPLRRTYSSGRSVDFVVANVAQSDDYIARESVLYERVQRLRAKLD